LPQNLPNAPGLPIRLPHWLLAIVAAAGGVGLFVIGFLDSSVLTFPVINDLLVIELSMHTPARMPYYALMATLGSTLGCTFLYLLARKGGEALFRKQAGARAEKIRRWVHQNGFTSILLTALLPPPTPFKIFILAAAAFGVPLRAFVVALLIARSLRYFAIGFLAVHYGAAVGQYIVGHKLMVALITLVVCAVVYTLLRFVFRAEKIAPTAD
jgi:membrane protein YqaA with SNARE-associated domain